MSNILSFLTIWLRASVIFLIKILNIIVPKKDRIVLFYSYPPYAGNCKALYEFIKQKNTRLKSIWVLNDVESLNNIRKHGIEAYSIKSLTGIKYMLQAKFFFETHPSMFSEIKSKKQVLISLWHGMPLKAMGFIDKTESKKQLMSLRKYARNVDYLISTSQITKNAMVACFHIDPQRVIITGQPRNDKLFNAELQKSYLSNLLSLFKKSLNDYNGIVMYLPTFRSGYHGRQEGDSFLSTIDNNDIEKLQAFLEYNKLLFIIKAHPLEEQLVVKYITEGCSIENILLLTNKMLAEYNIDVYDILGAIDFLITDYSSIYFDYLLLDKPVIFLCSDLRKYETIRGFALTPVDFWMPGPIVINCDELLREMDKFINNNEYFKKERILINRLINYYTDNNSSMRVYNLIV